jgi:hypothetical protein
MWDICASKRKIIIKKKNKKKGDTNNINTAQKKIATLNLFQTPVVQSDPLASEF